MSEGSGRGEVLWVADSPGNGPCYLVLFEHPEALALRTVWRRAASGGGYAKWRGPGVTLSFRRGRLDTYLLRTGADGSTPLNMSTDVRFVDRFVQDLTDRDGDIAATVDPILARLADRALATAEAAGVPVPADPHRLGVLPTLLALSYPVLGQAMAAGVTAPRTSVPTSVSTALRRRSARSAARHLFGAKATRAVVRSLARSLVGPVATPWSDRRMPVNLLNLEVATAAGRRLEPDQIADLLARPPVSSDGVLGLSRTDLRSARAFLGGLSPARALRLGRQVVGHEQGPMWYRDLVGLWELEGRPDPRALPRDLREAHDRAAARLRTAGLPDLELDAYPTALRDLYGRRAGTCGSSSRPGPATWPGGRGRWRTASPATPSRRGAAGPGSSASSTRGDCATTSS